MAVLAMPKLIGDPQTCPACDKPIAPGEFFQFVRWESGRTQIQHDACAIPPGAFDLLKGRPEFGRLAGVAIYGLRDLQGKKTAR